MRYKMTTIIKNGTIITADKTYKADIHIEGEKIKKIAKKITPKKDDTIIDARGLEVYPGFIDSHTHFELPFMGTVSADNFQTGSIAAACGGVTSFIDYAMPVKGQKLTDTVKLWHKKADGKAAVDYGFHMGIVEFNDQTEKEVSKVIDAGITSFKCFFAYKGALMVDDSQFIRVLESAKKYGGLMLLHAENGEVISYLTNQFISKKLTAPMYHELAHPACAEGEAVHRAAVLAETVDAPIYIVHLSSNDGLEQVEKFRKDGLRIFAETCPQYLLLSKELYRKKGFEGAKWVMSPPLRDKSNNEKLWHGLKKEFIQVIATDHCSFNFKTQKTMGKDTFTKIPNGIPGIGNLVNLVYTYGVRTGKITRNQFAAALSTNPAKIFGLYPKKGKIAVGADADITIINPNKKGIVSFKNSHHNVDYSAYEGLNLNGMVDIVISRGKVIAKENKFVGSKNHGRFIKRNKFSL